MVHAQCNSAVSAYRVSDRGVEVLSERVSFREAGGGVFDQIESLQLPKRRQQLFHLKEMGTRWTWGAKKQNAAS